MTGILPQALPEDRCTLSAGCNAPFETTVVGWAGGTGWVFDACWQHARQYADLLTAAAPISTGDDRIAGFVVVHASLDGREHRENRWWRHALRRAGFGQARWAVIRESEH